MARISCFQIPFDDPDRAIKFYQRVFGWQFDKFNGPLEYCNVKTGKDSEAGIDGELAKRSIAIQAARNMIYVPSIDGYTTKILSEGGKVLIPKSEIPGVGLLDSVQRLRREHVRHDAKPLEQGREEVFHENN